MSALRLYRRMQQTALQYPDFGLRDYARHRIRDGFASNRAALPESVPELFKAAEDSLEILKRTTLIWSIYYTDRHIFEYGQRDSPTLFPPGQLPS